jgi:hypothetical protein
MGSKQAGRTRSEGGGRWELGEDDFIVDRQWQIFKLHNETGRLWRLAAAGTAVQYQIIQSLNVARQGKRFRIGPIGTGFQIDFQGDFEDLDARHLLGNELGELGKVGFGDFEDQFIVNLEQHPCGGYLIGQSPGNGDHRQFDQVGRGALDDRVDGGPLGEVPLPAGGIADALNGPPSAEDSFNIPRFSMPG